MNGEGRDEADLKWVTNDEGLSYVLANTNSQVRLVMESVGCTTGKGRVCFQIWLKTRGRLVWDWIMGCVYGRNGGRTWRDACGCVGTGWELITRRLSTLDDLKDVSSVLATYNVVARRLEEKCFWPFKLPLQKLTHLNGSPIVPVNACLVR